MTVATNQRMTLDEYLNYDDGTDTHYELVDGVLVEMGAESTLNTRIAVFLIKCFLLMGLDDALIGIKQKIEVNSTSVTAREPDLMIHSEASAKAIDEATQAIIKRGHPVPLIAIEIVSPGQPGEKNYDRDYVEKRREYAARGISEYWLIDPHHQVVLVLVLQGKSYQEQRFTGNMAIVSPAFPNLKLTADRVLKAGR